MWFDNIARQRGPLGPERSIWACLTSSEHEICQIPIKRTDLGASHALSYGFFGWPRCNPMKQTDNILCHTRREPKRIEKSCDIDDKPSQIIYSFGLILPAIFPGTDISSCVCIVLLFETSSSSHVECLIARQRGPLCSETSTGPCLTASNHEIYHILHHARDLGPA